jgi:hypothetical protein
VLPIHYRPQEDARTNSFPLQHDPFNAIFRRSADPKHIDAGRTAPRVEHCAAGLSALTGNDFAVDFRQFGIVAPAGGEGYFKPKRRPVNAASTGDFSMRPICG